MCTLWNKIYMIENSFWKFHKVLQILVLLGMYFDAMVVFFTRLWPYCVCHKTASRNTSFLVTCLVKKHHLFDKPIPKNLHSQLETCVCTCNFMVKKWITTWEKVTDIKFVFSEKATKDWWNLHHLFNTYYKMSNWRWRFRQFLWPS